MKNIHLIPTDKPSRLHLWTDENGTRPALCELEYSHTRNTQHIYITSDEEIKEGDYRLNIQRDYFKKSDKEGLDYYNKRNDVFKKVILTTDQDLIKDSVQAIDDEFLNWFVKNPSCEEVEVERGKIKLNDDGQEYGFPDMSLYKIIIPKEEPTAYHYLSCCRSIEECHCGKYPKQIKCYCGHTTMCDCSPIDEPKQETLEEAAENYGNSIGNKNGTAQFDFIRGAKWQQERMYSEIEDFINWIDEEEIPRKDGEWIMYLNEKDTYLTTKQLFEQFKKK